MTRLLLFALLLSLASCKRDDTEPLVVFAAASLRDAFTAIEADFEREHPGVDVRFNFAGTQELRTQLEHGAPADVFASADTHHMQALVDASRVEKPTVFAKNEPVIVVSTKDAPEIRGLADLPSAERIVIGAPEVPIGRYTLEIFDRAGPGFRERALQKVVSRELNVRQVLAKVMLGEAQAGIVYRTDAKSAGDKLRTLSIPPHTNVVAEYPIAIVSGAPRRRLAEEWVRHVLSAEGQAALSRAGFGGP